ncbi:MAG: hypothetical protein JO352_17505 [Chloroflexi bacterium]|nr:hypothetical protein [Chloroflexota bacterium]
MLWPGRACSTANTSCQHRGQSGPARRSVDVDKLVAATGAYAVHVPKNNPLGIAPGSGRSAADGFGVLLTGFAKGTHIIHTRWSIGTSKWDITFTVRVH